MISYKKSNKIHNKSRNGVPARKDNHDLTPSSTCKNRNLRWNERCLSKVNFTKEYDPFLCFSLSKRHLDGLRFLTGLLPGNNARFKVSHDTTRKSPFSVKVHSSNEITLGFIFKETEEAESQESEKDFFDI